MSALRNFFMINRRLLPIKAHFGLFNAGCSPVQPTMPVYAKVLHFSEVMVGTIYTILPVIALFMKPLFCTIADKMKWHRGILILWEIILILSYFAIQFIPPDNSAAPIARLAVTNVSACMSANSSTPYFLFESENCSWNCPPTASRCEAWIGSKTCLTPADFKYFVGMDQIDCFPISTFPSMEWKEDCVRHCFQRDVDIVGYDVGYEQDDSVSFQQWQFYIFLLCMTGAWVGTSIITTISDAVCIEICEDPSIYGRQRHWGTLAWGVLVIINGFVIDAVSTQGEEKNYTPAFYMMLVPLVLDIVLFYFLKFDIPERSQSIASEVWKVMLKPKALLFTTWCMMFGVCLALIWNFLFLLLEDLAQKFEDGSIYDNMKTIEGVVSGAQCFIGESPGYFFGGRIVEKIGHNLSLSLVFGLMGFRFIFYSLLVNPWWCIPIEFLQSSYGLFYSTMTYYGKELSTPGTEATVQSILAAAAEGVGVAVGSYVCGIMYKEYGGSLMFQIFGIIFIVMGVINAGVELYTRMRNKNVEVANPNQTD